MRFCHGVSQQRVSGRSGNLMGQKIQRKTLAPLGVRPKQKNKNPAFSVVGELLMTI
jgi:hypothetical protein